MKLYLLYEIFNKIETCFNTIMHYKKVQRIQCRQTLKTPSEQTKTLNDV